MPIKKEVLLMKIIILIEKLSGKKLRMKGKVLFKHEKF